MNPQTSQYESTRRDERPLRIAPASSPPDQAARERFAKRRAAGRIAESMASALGRSNAEAGTIRLATLLAADAGALKIASTASAEPVVEPKRMFPIVTRSKNGKNPQPLI